MGSKEKSCNAKQGNPFGPFWDTYNVDFVQSEFYGPLHYDMYHTDMKIQWRKRYPAATWPVLAFTGAPGSFPVQFENKHLQKCLIWNNDMLNKAKAFIKEKLPKGAFVGIHLRNGIDWVIELLNLLHFNVEYNFNHLENNVFLLCLLQVRACEHISFTPNLFAAPQCLGYRNERGKATMSMCLPSFELIVRHLKRVIRNGNDIKSVFVASDNNYMLDQLGEALARMKVSYTFLHIIIMLFINHYPFIFNFYIYRYQYFDKNRQHHPIWI